MKVRKKFLLIYAGCGPVATQLAISFYALNFDRLNFCIWLDKFEVIKALKLATGSFLI